MAEEEEGGIDVAVAVVVDVRLTWTRLLQLDTAALATRFRDIGTNNDKGGFLNL